jgi:hypothetical protein
MQAACLHARPCAEAGIPYDLQLYPRKTHSIAGPDVRSHIVKPNEKSLPIVVPEGFL